MHCNKHYFSFVFSVIALLLAFSSSRSTVSSSCFHNGQPNRGQQIEVNVYAVDLLEDMTDSWIKSQRTSPSVQPADSFTNKQNTGSSMSENQIVS